MGEDEYSRYLPKNDRWKERYKEPEPLDTAELLELPEGLVVGEPVEQAACHELSTACVVHGALIAHVLAFNCR